MEALNEQQYPLVKLVLEQALEPELVRVQVLQVQALRVQALVRVQLETLVQAQPLVQLELLTQEQSQLELERRAQQEPLELQVQEPEPAPELHVFLERLPLRQGLTQHI